jgi:uncharacterized FlaG/YvyC family protein
MAENLLPSVSSVSSELANSMSQAESGATVSAKVDTVVRETRVSPVEKKDAAQETSSFSNNAVGKGLSNIYLRFRIDPETNDVTLFVLDRAAKEVVRTIPADELAKLGPGELFELFA